jgi:hypothetical protein
MAPNISPKLAASPQKAPKLSSNSFTIDKLADRMNPWLSFQLQKCLCACHALNEQYSNTTYLKVENAAQTT